MLDRFPTKDRLLRWGMEGVDPACLLCNSEVENINHLFFDCSYNSLVWSSIAHHCQLQAPSNRDDNIHMLQSLCGNKDLRRLTILSHQASIYWLWNEWNTKLHQQTFRSIDTLIASIDRHIWNNISSFRETNSRASSAMIQLWFLRL